MPTATLTFDLETEREQFDEAVNGWAYRATLHDFDGWLRSQLKHGKRSDAEFSLLTFARSQLHELAEGNGVEVW